MIFYLSIFLLLLLFSINDTLKEVKPINGQLFDLAVWALCLVAGLRFETGVDWMVYQEMVDKIPKLTELTSFSDLPFSDLGFSLLISIIKTVGGGLQMLFFVVAVISFSLLRNSLKMYSPYVLTCIFLYFGFVFFNMEMNLIRQGLALNIFLFSLQYVRKRHVVNYMICGLLAFLMHWSAIILLPMYFVIDRHYSFKFVTIFFFSCVAIFVFKISIGSFILDIVYVHSNDTIKERIDLYTCSVWASNRQLGLSFFYNIIVFLVFMYKRKFLSERFEYFNIFFNIFLLHCFFYFVLFDFIEISDRLRLYMNVYVFALPCLFSVFSKQINKLIVLCFLGLSGFAFCRAYVTNDPRGVAYRPYQNYIVYEVFGLESDAEKRIEQYNKLFNAERNENKK